MPQYIARRLLQFIPVFFGVTLILFLIANFMPGADPIQMRYGERTPPPEIKAQLIKEYGLDLPWWQQYLKYLDGLFPIDYEDGSLAVDRRRPGYVDLHGPRGLDDPQGDVSLYHRAGVRRDHHRDHRRHRRRHHLGGEAVLLLGRLRHPHYVYSRLAPGVLVGHDAPMVLRHLAQRRHGRAFLLTYLGRVGHLPRLRLRDPAGHHACVGVDRVRGAHHAQPTARGQRPGLHPHRAREGQFLASAFCGATR